STQRKHSSECSALLPTSSLWCQQRVHFSAEEAVMATFKPSTAELASSSGACAKGAKRAVEVIVTKRNSSAKGCSNVSTSSCTYNTASPAKLARTSFSLRASSLALLTACLRACTCTQKARLISALSGSVNKPSSQTPENTDS